MRYEGRKRKRKTTCGWRNGGEREREKQGRKQANVSKDVLVLVFSPSLRLSLSLRREPRHESDKQIDALNH
jgi:hypothetical protein